MSKNTSKRYGGAFVLTVILATVLRVSHLHRFDEKGFIGPDSARVIRQVNCSKLKNSLINLPILWKE